MDLNNSTQGGAALVSTAPTARRSGAPAALHGPSRTKGASPEPLEQEHDSIVRQKTHDRARPPPQDRAAFTRAGTAQAPRGRDARSSVTNAPGLRGPETALVEPFGANAKQPNQSETWGAEVPKDGAPESKYNSAAANVAGAASWIGPESSEPLPRATENMNGVATEVQGALVGRRRDADEMQRNGISLIQQVCVHRSWAIVSEISSQNTHARRLLSLR